MKSLYLTLAVLVTAIVGCEPDPGISQVNDELRARQEKLKLVVQRYENQRDAIREEITKLRILKGGLEAPDTNIVATVTNQPIIVITNQTIVVTNVTVNAVNQVSPFETFADGRISDKLLMINHFKSSEVFCLPYSPHEFIVKSNDIVFYACKEKSNGDTTNVYAFPICFFK